MASCREGCVDEFRASNCTLNHDNPELFVSSQWLTKCSCWGACYVVYRLLAAAFWLVMLITSWTAHIDSSRSASYNARWFIYLTNWGLLALTLDVVVQGATTAHAFARREECASSGLETKMTWYLKMQWVLSNVSLCVGIFITIAAGIVFYSAGISLSFLDVVAHLVNSVYLLLNLFISAAPVRLYHVLHTMAFSTGYVLFSVTLKYTADISAYPVVDWSDPKSASMAACLGGYLSAVIIWLIIYGLYRGRLTIYKVILEKSL